MDNFTHLISGLLQGLLELGSLIFGTIISIELWLRAQLTQFGLSHNVQTVILLVVTGLLIFKSLQWFGGLIRVAVLLLLILIVVRIVMPLVQQ